MSLKKKRLDAGLSLAELSRLSGIHAVTLCKIERGSIRPENITLKNAIRLAEALNCAPQELLETAEKT